MSRRSLWKQKNENGDYAAILYALHRLYDNIEYTKKGWFNRNRILDGDHDRLFTIPIKKASDYLPVNQRFLSDDSQKEIARTLRIIQDTYRKAPQYPEAYPLIEACFLFDQKNLFDYIHHSLHKICAYLEIDTKIVISSTVPIDHQALKADKKVMTICKALGTTTYINAIGGTELYDKDEFAANGLELKFIKAHPIQYTQFDDPFVPWLSIIDVLMFNDTPTVRQMLKEYDLV
jgi:hypothetical protein